MIRIIEDDLRGPEIAELLRFHLEEAHRKSPPGAVFALDLDALRKPDITFWSAWIETPTGPQLAGCGAVKELDPTHGEVKSMRTAAAHLRKGVGAAILRRIIECARERRYARLSLETGSGEKFDAAHGLYRRFGFVECGPFGSYADTEFSRYFALELRTPI